MKRGLPRELVFTPEEYAARQTATRAGMRRKGLDALCLTVPENIFYLSGYQTFGLRNFQALVVPADGAPFLVLRLLESHLAAVYSVCEKVVTYGDTDDPWQALAAAIADAGLGAARVGLEDLPYSRRLKLAELLPHAKLKDGSGLVELCRRVKSPAEIEQMREAARLTDLGVAAALEVVGEGATENDVAAAAWATMTRAGAEYLPQQPTVTSGWRAGIPHTTYRRRRLERGDAVLIELSSCYNRYTAPIVRSAAVGEAGAALRRMSDCCLAAVEVTLNAIRPGTPAGAVDDACRAEIERWGMYENFRKRVGYGVGCAFPPGWIEGAVLSLDAKNRTPLAAGMVVHIPVICRAYGEFAVGYSETVLVTEHGAEPLTRHAPRALAVR